jgi:hypothetical protein
MLGQPVASVVLRIVLIEIYCTTTVMYAEFSDIKEGYT